MVTVCCVEDEPFQWTQSSPIFAVLFKNTNNLKSSLGKKEGRHLLNIKGNIVK